MMGNFDNLNREVARQGDFWELRSEYRRENLKQLREREGIPVPQTIDGKVMYKGDDGEWRPWAIGKRKGPSVEEVDEFWAGGVDALRIEPLPVAADGVPIEREIRDLKRDCEFLLRSGGVVMEGSEPYPDLVITDPNDEHEVDRKIQEMVERRGE